MHGQRLGQSRLSSAPIGLQLVGPHLGDARLLRAAALFEAARPWVQHRPSATV
jgi:Asp-tRNA(Asn)/Glu-tRNA(Gln) amidotransferase A subunit family amidase